jgi:hypothetical protein
MDRYVRKKESETTGGEERDYHNYRRNKQIVNRNENTEFQSGINTHP